MRDYVEINGEQRRIPEPTVEVLDDIALLLTEYTTDKRLRDARAGLFLADNQSARQASAHRIYRESRVDCERIMRAVFGESDDAYGHWVFGQMLAYFGAQSGLGEMLSKYAEVGGEIEEGMRQVIQDLSRGPDSLEISESASTSVQPESADGQAEGTQSATQSG